RLARFSVEDAESSSAAATTAGRCARTRATSTSSAATDATRNPARTRASACADSAHLVLNQQHERRLGHSVPVGFQYERAIRPRSAPASGSGGPGSTAQLLFGS